MADQLALGIGLGIGISAGIAGEMPDADHRVIGRTLDALSNDLMTHRSIAKNARDDSRLGVDPKRYREMVRALRDDAAAKCRVVDERLRAEGKTPLARLDRAYEALREVDAALTQILDWCSAGVASQDAVRAACELARVDIATALPPVEANDHG